MSWYNILKRGGQDDWSKKRRKRSILDESRYTLSQMYQRHVATLQADALSDYMDTTVRAKLGIIPPQVKFGGKRF